MRKHLARACSGLLWAIAGIGMAPAADFFMKIGDIEGECQLVGFEGWSEAVSADFESRVPQGKSGRLAVIKPLDKATPLLAKACHDGTIFRRGALVIRRSSPTGEPYVFAKIELRDLVLQGFRQASSTEDPSAPLEWISLGFREIQYTYLDPKGAGVAVYADADQGDDSDGDGMTDEFEDLYGFDKLVPDSDSDSDKDGLTNLEEFRLGLNPRRSSSRFQVTGGSSPQNPAEIRLQWETKPGVVYRLFFTPDLGQPFQFVREVTADDFQAFLDLGRSGIHGFYQVRAVEP